MQPRPPLPQPPRLPARLERPHRRPDARSGTYDEYRHRSTIYTRREAELTSFYDRFDLHHDAAGEYWQCKTCQARGESWRPLSGSYDYPFAIGEAPLQHPTCTPALQNKEPTT
ncbi:hypothetical protein [Streptomyces sp. NPDC096311]|uniref:hypothetical protein n=1 Tax=Streptomyces sp. NPDC096311 TaxID=3366083 RepID=UPI0037FB45CD